MNDVDAFLATIREEPDDDTPRLVFADWLEEHNDPRGEFIRLQCELNRWVPDVDRRSALQNRERELLREHRKKWLGSLANLPESRCRFDRGLIAFSSNGAMPLRWNPWIQSLHFRLRESTTQPISQYLTPSRLKHLSRLDVTCSQLPLQGIASRVLDKPASLGVQHLRVANNRPLRAGMLPTLPGWPWPQLRTLDFEGSIIGLDTTKSLQTEARWFQDYQPTPRGVEPELLMNSIGMRLRRIPAGSFWMGSSESEEGHDPDEFRHFVRLTKPYYMGVYPVTQGQYARIMGENPSHFNEGLGGGFNHPVEMINWEEANTFCQTLSDLESEKNAGRVYRLPTEAEWEYACRAGTTTRFSFGDEWEGNLANILHHYDHPMPVGYFQPNSFGIYDTHGQVREWCQDWYRREYYRHSQEENPTGPPDGESKVIRGGSWDISSEQYARSAYRVYFRPDGRLLGIGFRVVCEIGS